MSKGHRLDLLVVACVLVSGCSGAVASATLTEPTAGPSSKATAYPSPTVTAAPLPTPTATPTLPAEPILVETTTTDSSVVYQIAVAPSPTQLDEASARARATKIGALVGLSAPDSVWQEPTDAGWEGDWASRPGQSCPAPTCIEGFPIDPSYPAIRLDMDAYGTVLSFSRTLGPTEAAPAHLISEAQARKVAGGKPNRVELVWALEPPSSQTFRLAWRLDYAKVQPDGESWPCVVWLDAGSGAQLDTACVS